MPTSPHGDFAQGFPPVSAADAQVLILGSLPGRRSLECTQYYAQPRNAFWRIMGELVGASPQLEYHERLQNLRNAGIALWDVIASAERPGSLDARIVADSVVVNDFAAFFAAHTSIQTICFNGQTAAKLFSRHVAVRSDGATQQELITLPSTSPANAAVSYAEKLRRWRSAFNQAGCLREPAG